LWDSKSLLEVLKINFEDLVKMNNTPIQEAFY